MILALTLSFSPWAIPLVLSALIVAFCIYLFAKRDLWSGLFALAYGVGGLLVVWLAFFAIMYLMR